MRNLHVLTFGFVLAGSAWALPTFPTTFNDALASNDPSDVIGNADHFDIHSLKFVSYNAGTNTMQIDIRFNFGGGAALNPFTVGSTLLSASDLLFRASNGNQYAFVVNSHDGLAAATTYRIQGTQTAQAVLDPDPGNYRPSATVWASPTGASLVGAGSKSISTVNGVSTHLLATLNVQMNQQMLNDLNGGFDFYFTSATCGNDEIFGSVAAVPEPGTWALLGGGMIALAGLRRRK
ncbi:MAG: PEP-CTERM sorting domain-containing protein [Acidobacteria bacterium]|nr:PEP-CTERM sorting domain-containing protein [Acidobacteriota bacterium]